jgi:glutamyl/glutaminyl-tRNA synthetase
MFRFRIAPTPSGYLHRGNLASFLLTAALAKFNQASLFLRIDDMDNLRKRDEYLADIFKALEWLGITDIEGPQGVEDFEKNYSQHKRMDLYVGFVHQLQQSGKTYQSTISRSRQKSVEGDYRKTIEMLRADCEKSFDEAQNFTVRVMTDLDFNPSWPEHLLNSIPTGLLAETPDFIIQRRDKLPAYPVCSLVDDLHFGINCWVRGQDLLSSTAGQFFLLDLVNNKPSVHCWHHPLILGFNNEKLSKSAGDGVALSHIRNTHEKLILLSIAAEWLGLPPYHYEKVDDLVAELKRAPGKHLLKEN